MQNKNIKDVRKVKNEKKQDKVKIQIKMNKNERKKKITPRIKKED